MKLGTLSRSLLLGALLGAAPIATLADGLPYGYTPTPQTTTAPAMSDYLAVLRNPNYPTLFSTVGGVLSASSLQFGGLGTLFPFGGTYAGQQSFAPGTSPLANNAARTNGVSPNGASLNITNLFPHGVLNNGGAVNLTTNPFADDLTSDPGYGCLLGMAHISDIANGQETGAVTVCATANGVSPLVHVPGTFTARQFIPSTPTTLPSGYPTTAVWIFSDDQPVPWEGLANATLNKLGQATAWTVIGGGWYQQGNVSGGTGLAGTPSGSSAYLGWQDKQWVSNFIGGLGWRGITGTVASGNQTITGITGSAACFLAPRQWLTDSGIDAGSPTVLAAHSRVVSVANDCSSIVVAPPPIGSATEGLAFSVQPDNNLVIMEGDVNNGTGELYDTNTYVFSGTTTASSRHVSGLSGASINSIYPRLACKASPANWTGDQYIDAITYGDSPSLDLEVVASASGSVTITCQEEYDFGGAGLDIRGDDNGVNFVARGFGAVGFRGMGAYDSYFLSAPGANGGDTAFYGFRSDHSWNDVNFDFAITSDLTSQIFFSATKTGGLLVDENTHTLPASTLPGPTLLHLGQADGAVTQATFDGFGAYSELLFRTSHGTAASPTALTTSDQVGGLDFGGYDGTSWVPQGAVIATVPAATWSSSSHPLDVYFKTTPIGSTTPVTRLRIFNDGGLATGAAVDEGAGTLNLAGNYYANGTAGVSCAANTVSLTTLAVTNGIVTHC